MQKLKKPVSLLLALIMVFSVLTAVPLIGNAYEDEEQYNSGRDAGAQAAEDDWYNYGEGYSQCDDEDPDYQEGWSDGYADRWSELEAENPDDVDYWQEGHDAGSSAADDDYWAEDAYYGRTSCDYAYDDEQYETGWNDGYSEKWQELVEMYGDPDDSNDPGYEAGYSDGQSAAETDFWSESEYGTTTYGDEYSGTDYESGWVSGYSETWDRLVEENTGEEDHRAEGYSAGYDAGYSDYERQYDEGYIESSCDNPYGDGGSYSEGWSEGYSAGWAAAAAAYLRTYDDGREDGEAAAREDWDYREYGRTQPNQLYGSEYVNGWNDVYGVTYDDLQREYDDEEELFWSILVSGVIAAQTDWDNGDPKGTTQYNMTFTQEEAKELWYRFYNYKWEQLEEEYEESVVTNEEKGYSYYWNSGTLTFISGTFDNNFFDDEGISRSNVSMVSVKKTNGTETDVAFGVDCTQMFGGLDSCSVFKLGDVDTSAVTNMSNMFAGCSSAGVIDLSGWNTSNVVEQVH